MSETSRIDHELEFLSLAIRLSCPAHRVSTFLVVFQREYPESFIGASDFPARVHLRQTLRLCRRVWCPSFFNLFTAVAFADVCHFGFRLAGAFAFALRLGRLLVPTVSSFVSVLSAISTLTLEARVLCCRFTVSFASVAFFSFLATLLALAGFSFAFPFLGGGIDFHRVVFVGVSG